MKVNEPFESNKSSFPSKFKSIFTPQNTIAIYTVLTTLLVMRKRQGLEAMLEYIEKYLSVVDQGAPKLKHAVMRALNMMNVDKIYKDAMGDGNQSLDK